MAISGDVGSVVVGIDESADALDQVIERLLQAAGSALQDEVEGIVRVAETLTPVLTGALQRSGVVDDPAIDPGDEVSIIAAFGAGISAPYAKEQHENLLFAHPRGGQAKFFEQPFLEAIPGMADRLAASIQRKLGS